MKMNVISAVLAEQGLPEPSGAVYEYVVAGNGLWIRAEDSRIEALVPVAPAALNGLSPLEPMVRLKVERIPAGFLHALLASARARLPNEAAYQLHWTGEAWRAVMPPQTADLTAVEYEDDPAAVVDLHSHNSMAAFFSDTDDGDEQGLRFYCVIGRIDTDAPEIVCRVGVYGHHWPVPVTAIFDSAGPFEKAQVGPEA